MIAREQRLFVEEDARGIAVVAHVKEAQGE
jgi:hypothetical protein